MVETAMIPGGLFLPWCAGGALLGCQRLRLKDYGELAGWHYPLV